MHFPFKKKSFHVFEHLCLCKSVMFNSAKWLLCHPRLTKCLLLTPYPGKFHIIISFYISRYPQSAGRSSQGWYLPTFPHSVELWRMWLQTKQQAVTAMHLPSQVQTVSYIHLLNLKLYSSTFKIHQWRLSSQRPKAAQIRNKDELYSRM